MFNIDKNKLRRDYEKEPLIKYKDKPYEEDLKYLFIDLNLTLFELEKYFNYSRHTIGKWLSRAGIHKDRKKVAERTFQTTLERHGQMYMVQDIERREEGMLKKYGARNPMQVETFKESAMQTNLKNLGVLHPTQSKEVLDLRNANNMKKYGYEHVSQRPNHYKRRKKRKEEQE